MKKKSIKSYIAMLFSILFGCTNLLAQNNYEMSNYSYLKNQDGTLSISIQFEKNANGRITEANLGDDNSTIICARNANEQKYRTVAVESSKTNDAGAITKQYKLEVGEHNGDFFRLINDWRMLNFHLEVSSAKTCRNANVREPNSYDIQIIKTLDPAPTTKVELGNSKMWVAERVGALFKTSYLEVQLKTNRCDELKVEMKKGDTLYASTSKVQCSTTDFQRVPLMIEPGFEDNINAGNYKVIVNGGEVGTLTLTEPSINFRINEIKFLDGTKEVEAKQNVFTLNQKDDDNTFEINALSPGSLEIEKPSCVKSTPNASGNKFTFKLNFKECNEDGDLYAFKFKGEGTNKQSFMDKDKTFFVKINNKTEFVGHVIFGERNNSPLLRYKLTRNVPQQVDTVFKVGAAEFPVSLNIDVSQTPTASGYYEVEIPRDVVTAIQNNPQIKSELRAGRSVPIIFKLRDLNSDANNRVFGEFEVQTYGFNNAAIQEVVNTSQKFTADRVVTLAKRILNLENIQNESDIPAEKTPVYNELKNILGYDNTSKRNNIIKILSIAGTVGLRLLGVPITL